MSKVINKHSRMPRKYKRRLPAVQTEAAPKLPVLADGLKGQDPKVILLRYLTDESTEVIARDYGVTRQALGQYLLRHAEEDWKEAQVARAIAKKEKSEEAIETATDPLELAKAREALKAAQWDLERTCRRIYGQDHNLNINVDFGDLGDRLRRARERTIDVEVVNPEPA